ncbi:uncharacterized protein K02A2.6-like [Sitophilus oryzae]|uniref:RNA-directed DNA polymerase n=1 Tax=Sitophilus oryzae TaxID=7048 RepID=A0A6J2X7D0_SITOR|nr:uncharacterized protein K02A2.6-like [Sitophilus oryzae]
MLIDSGSKSNLITDKSWVYLKQNKVKIFNQVRNPDKVFLAYGSKTPLNIIGSFEAEIQVGQNIKVDTFYVIKGGTKNLIGKNTATALGILKIGFHINVIESFPKFKNVIVDIPIDESVTPVVQPYRRIPVPLEAKVEAKLLELIESDIIEAVNEPSKWVSPIVPVLKENGEIRICIDMRRANKAIMRENHPLPTMDVLLPNFKNAKVFSRLDIRNAFHQLELSENCRYITTFITSKGLYRYKRLMFGITCAPEIFQKTLERILAKCEGTKNFVDDIVIFGQNDEEHDKRLKKTLETLKNNNVLLNDQKCQYRLKKVNFLGHTLTAEGVTPLESYIAGILSFRKPNTIEETQSFLGLINYVGKWIPNLATLTEPFRMFLRLKLSKHASIQKYWSKEQECSFNKLKECLANIRTLGYYNPNEKTQVMADASPVGLGAVLIQINDQGPRVIAFGNKSLTECERRYCQTEKEALALVWAVEHFKVYLYGKDSFELITDHKPLEAIFHPKSKPCARIERWVLRLQSFNFKVIYKPGKSNIADPLSRLCIQQRSTHEFDEEQVQQIIEYARPVAVPLEEIRSHSKRDSEIRKVWEGLNTNNWDDSVRQYKLLDTELCFQDNILLRGTRIVIPRDLRRLVLEAAHEGHPGIVAMKNRIRAKVWWPHIDKDVEKVIKSCKGCTLVSTPLLPNPLKRRELPQDAWIDVAIDYMGPLPSGEYLFVIVDYYSRYKEIKITRDISTSFTVKSLQEIFSRLGNPVSITSDNGRQFTSAEFKGFCKERCINLYNSIPYWPQQNGEVERQNRDILKRLKISQALKKDWKVELMNYLTMYNSTPHTVTGKSPSELFFKRTFRDKIPNIKDTEYSIINEDVRDRDQMEKEKGRDYANRKRRAKETELEGGTKVYVKNLVKESKVTPPFSSVPHTVLDKRGGDVRLRNDNTGEEVRRNILHLKKVEGQWQSINNDANDNVSIAA